LSCRSLIAARQSMDCATVQDFGPYTKTVLQTSI
jgi:hypothetical protein